MSQSEKRPARPMRTLVDPAARRRRDLAVLALARQGFATGDLAVWFGVSDRHVRRVVAKARSIAEALGYAA